MKISAQAALEQLLDPARKRGVFGFGEGLRKSEILALLEKSKLVSGKVSKLPKPVRLFEVAAAAASVPVAPGFKLANNPAN